MHDLSYLAGIIDGEGHVAFSSCGVDRKRFVIEVKMTSENVIDWLLKNYGGLKTFRGRQRPHHKDQWRWRIQGAAALSLYEELKPLLKVKNNAVQAPRQSKW